MFIIWWTGNILSTFLSSVWLWQSGWSARQLPEQPKAGMSISNNKGKKRKKSWLKALGRRERNLINVLWAERSWRSLVFSSAGDSLLQYCHLVAISITLPVSGCKACSEGSDCSIKFLKVNALCQWKVSWFLQTIFISPLLPFKVSCTCAGKTEQLRVQEWN